MIIVTVGAQGAEYGNRQTCPRPFCSKTLLIVSNIPWTKSGFNPKCEFTIKDYCSPVMRMDSLLPCSSISAIVRIEFQDDFL